MLKKYTQIWKKVKNLLNIKIYKEKNKNVLII